MVFNNFCRQAFQVFFLLLQFPYRPRPFFGRIGRQLAAVNGKHIAAFAVTKKALTNFCG
jgi:hypothetical protein